MVCNPHSTDKLEKKCNTKRKEMLQSCKRPKKWCSAFKFYPAAKIENNFFKIFYFGKVKNFKKRVITEVVKLNQDNSK